MLPLMLCLAFFFIIFLWSKVHQNSLEFRSLESRFNELEKKMADLARIVQDLRSKARAQAETAAHEPSPVIGPKAIDHPVAAAVDIKPETPKIPLVLKPVSPPPVAASAHIKSETPKIPLVINTVTPPPAAIPPAATPPVAPKSVFQPPHAAAPAWKLPSFDWESLVGVKLFSWIAGIALLLAVVFFLRYSVNQGWLVPKVRMIIGILAGIALLAVCELKAARRYPVTANAMDASAIAILFSTFYAARARWDLIGAVPAFMLLVLVAAVAVVLSIRRDSVFIALLGLLGGFATPILLSTEKPDPISLFTYLVLLNAGLSWVAVQKKWPLLTTLSLAFTVFYQWGWVIKFLTESQLPLALGIFLVFPVLAFAAAAFGQKELRSPDWTSLYGQTANITALLPLLFTLYLAAVPAYGQHYALMFGFLLVLDIGLFTIAVARGQEILHLVGGLSTLLIPSIWLWNSYSSNAWPAVLIFIVLFTFFYLFAPLIARRFNRGFAEQGKWAAYTAPLLLFAFPALISLEPACANPGLLFAVLLLLMLAIAGYAIFAETGAIYIIAALFALLAETTWAYRYLAPERLFSGLALFGIFGLLYIAVPLLARKWNKPLRLQGFESGLLLISIALLAFFAIEPLASNAIWGLMLLLLILNAGLLWQSSHFKLPLIAVVGLALSWVIFGVLWANIPLDTALIPALTVVTGFALFVLAGNIWLKRHSDVDELEENGIFLGLAGHIFLGVVAVQQALSVPPWPFLAVLLILNLAIGFSALYLRRHGLHGAAMVASALLLMLWAGVAGDAPWPAVAIVSAGVLSLFSFGWIYLARKAGLDSSPFSTTAFVTVILSQIVSIIASAQHGTPAVGFLLIAHMVFLVAILGLAWSRDKHEYAVIAVFPAAMAVSFWFVQHRGADFWPQQFLFATPLYLAFIAYPLLLGRRALRSIEPYVAAVLASVPFFFQARHAMMQAGWENIIGILPVSQALLMGLLLIQLLKMEPRGERSLGRLALVAGTVLAFITVAIPLQLEKEWITIGWALEAAALSWLYGKIPHKGLLLTATGLFAAVFVRLALNPAILVYAERSDTRIWNWYLYTYLISAAAMILGGWLLSKTSDTLVEGSFRVSKIAPAGGVVLLFLLLNIEIADFYSTGSRITFKFSATLAQDLTYTLGWALFAVALLAAGIALRNQPARIASLGLLVATSFKCFIHDLARLGELYRVMSFVGLGVCLALVALALQKFVFAARNQNIER